MDVLESKWKNLSLTEEELVHITVEEDSAEQYDIKSKQSLLGKMCSNKSVGKEILQTTMGKIQKISEKAIFKEITQSLFTITFATEADIAKILEGRP